MKLSKTILAAAAFASLAAVSTAHAQGIGAFAGQIASVPNVAGAVAVQGAGQVIDNVIKAVVITLPRF